MRISAGSRKGLSLPLPKGFTIRPTLGRVKEALFDILGTRVDSCMFLDLYSGTGSIGLEAHSRGASTVVFVEQSQKVSALLRRNVKRYCDSMPPDKQSSIHIHTLAVETYLTLDRHRTTPMDIIFADPPYDTPVSRPILDRITKGGWLHPTGSLVIEHRFKDLMDDTYPQLSRARTYKYGDSALSIYHHSHATSHVLC